jgi:hypothetical protein
MGHMIPLEGVDDEEAPNEAGAVDLIHDATAPDGEQHTPRRGVG